VGLDGSWAGGASEPPARGAVSAAALGARRLVVYGAVVSMAVAALGYELGLGTVETLLRGDPVVQFALIVGLYMSALGAGAYASRLVGGRLEHRCVEAMAASAALGGLSAPLLFAAFGLGWPFRGLLWAITVVLGALVGVQLPLLMRLVRREESFGDVVARSFAMDYAGALAGSLAFSLVLLPRLGLVRATLLVGLVHAASAGVLGAVLAWRDRGMRARLVLCGAVCVGLSVAMAASERIDALVEGGT
jgi:spermidine synthase